jgi:tight adherence protein B
MNRLEFYFENREEKKKNEGDKEEKSNIRANHKEVLGKIGKQLMRVLIFPNFKEKLDKRLEQADSMLKVEEYITFVLIVFLGVFYAVGVLTGNVIIGIVISVLCIFILRTRLTSRIRKRTTIFNEQLGDALEMMSGTLRAGFSLPQSIETVSEEMPDPIAKEFKKVVKELSVGVSLEKSLYNLLDRISTDDLELLVTAILIQRQIGGNLAEILDNISSTIRQRINLKGEVKTLTAQGRMSGLIISILPIAFSIIILLLNPEYILTLFQDPIGWLMVILAIIGQILGIFMIRRIIDIQY